MKEQKETNIIFAVVFTFIILLLLAVLAKNRNSEDFNGVGNNSLPSEKSYSILTTNEWELTKLNGTDASTLSTVPVTVTAVFTPTGELNGKGACNSYNGSYEVSGNDLTIGPVAMTMMFCEGLMDLEQAYVAMLGDVGAYNVVLSDDGSEILQLMDNNKTIIAEYAVLEKALLEGTNWDVTMYNNGKEAVRSLIIGTEITALFEDGKITGNASCNEYFGDYTLDGNNISVGELGVTRKLCQEPEGVMDQEQQYIESLQSTSVYNINIDNLEFRDDSGALMVQFEATN